MAQISIFLSVLLGFIFVPSLIVSLIIFHIRYKKLKKQLKEK